MLVSGIHNKSLELLEVKAFLQRGELVLPALLFCQSNWLSLNWCCLLLGDCSGLCLLSWLGSFLLWEINLERLFGKVHSAEGLLKGLTVKNELAESGEVRDLLAILLVEYCLKRSEECNYESHIASVRE